MKKILVLFFVLGILCTSKNNLSAQGLLGKIKEKVKQRADERTDEAIDKGLDKTEDVAKGDKTKIKTKTSGDNSNTSGNQSANTSAAGDITAYSKYDFVPGDKIIFQDNLKEEKEGEFPSQFASSGGQGQVYNFKGENVFQTIAENTDLTPRIKGMSYLPEQYTIEFDAYMEGDGEYIEVGLKGIPDAITFYGGQALYGYNKYTGEVPKPAFEQWYSDVHQYGWRHYAIAVNKNLMKAYVDQFRLLNVPNFDGKASSVSFKFVCGSSAETDCKNMFIKNIRIAEGGIDSYKKVEMEGKIVTHGITFDIDKATIKPESMGTLNQIYDLLKNNSSLKFEIDGHTDNSGTAAHNLSLSQQRAESVKGQLIKMGIDASRLTTKGLGDTKPISDNKTPEGKANNRRVEFIKM